MRKVSYVVDVLICRHDISHIYNIIFLLQAETLKLTILTYMDAKICIKVLLQWLKLQNMHKE